MRGETSSSRLRFGNDTVGVVDLDVDLSYDGSAVPSSEYVAALIEAVSATVTGPHAVSHERMQCDGLRDTGPPAAPARVDAV